MTVTVHDGNRNKNWAGLQVKTPLISIEDEYEGRDNCNTSHVGLKFSDLYGARSDPLVSKKPIVTVLHDTLLVRRTRNLIFVREIGHRFPLSYTKVAGCALDHKIFERSSFRILISLVFGTSESLPEYPLGKICLKIPG